MFTLFPVSRWTRGATLLSEPDLIPEDALRVALNVRLDRTLGAIEVRPGWIQRTASVLAGSIIYLSRLFTTTVTYGYAQIGTDLRRLSSAWGASTSIATSGTQVVSDANSPDGNSNLLKYFVNGTLAIKDSGTVVTTMGIAPPTAAPLSTSLAPDLVTLIALSLADFAGAWTGTNLATGPANDYTFVQVPTGSVTFSIAASTFGSITRDGGMLSTVVNLDTLVGGDALVKDDDYIFVWVRIDRPERLTFFQLDIDIDSTTTGVADAFRRNYYSIRLGALTLFSQGIDQWNKLEIRKSKFTRYGTDTTRTWAHARTFRIGFLTNTQGTVNIRVNDLKLRGGVGIEGDIEYTVCYRNNTTSARGNPPKDADGVVLYTTKLATNRQRINVITSNVREGSVALSGTTIANATTTIIGVGTQFLTELTVGDRISLSSAPTSYATVLTIVSALSLTTAVSLGDGTVQTLTRRDGGSHPGDTQIDRMMVWRKGGTFVNAVLVDKIPDTNVSPYLDNTSDATLILDVKQLETDNDVPPTGATRILFGPSATGHFFMIVNGFRLYISKSYERLENRVENWPAEGFAVIGDGSADAVVGIANATQIRVWTTERSYNVVGVGASNDTFLPVMLDGSRGCVGQFAACAGEGALYFVSQDGIYVDVGGRQAKLTGAIDPFFQGITVSGQLGWNTAQAQMALTRLACLHEPTGSTLIMAYCESGSATLNRFLAVKPNLQNGQITECFFGTSALTSLQALYIDSLNRELLAGGANGHVYRIEDPVTYSDAGTEITWQARTKSLNQGQQFQRKQYSSVLAEGNTGNQNLTLQAFYDRAASSESLSAVWSTSAENSQTSFRTSDETTLRYNIALNISGTTTARVAITGFVIHAFLHTDLRLIHDTNEFMFQTIHELRKVPLDINAPSALTMVTYLDGVIMNTQTITATSGRQRVDVEYPLGLRSKLFRIRWVSSANFELWEASAWLRPEPEDVLLWDSDEVYFELIQQLKLLTFDIDAPANVTVAQYIDGILKDSRLLFATVGRAGVRHLLPAGLHGKEFRVNLTSASRFQVWDLNGWFKPLGGSVGYAPRPMTRRQLAQVIQKLV